MTGTRRHMSNTRHADPGYPDPDSRSAKVGYMATDYRSAERVVGVPFRMTQQEREQLETEMQAEGLTSLQQLFEARVFGKPKPRRKPGPQPQGERLDISA